uniref:SFRICE001781.2 n=1 Tax=Spodoptera frugiperda TaxID=7108 RepID=A0A2H1V1E4_SPOFR
MTSVVDVAVDQNGNTTRMIFYPLVFLASAVWMYHRWQQQSRMSRMGNLLPGPTVLPLFGNALLALFKKPERESFFGFLEYADKYGYVVRGWLGSKLIIFLANPEDVEVILNSQVHIDKASEYRYFEPWLGEGLLISSGKGAKWRSHRKMIAPTFHINILKSFVDVFNQNSKSVVEKMRSEIGKTFDVHDHMSGVTVDIKSVVQTKKPLNGRLFIICSFMLFSTETAMGITKKTQDQSSFDYAMAVMKYNLNYSCFRMCDIIHQRHYKFWLRLDSIFKFHPLHKTQQKLLDIIHGLTNKVKIYQENKAKGIIPPSLQELTDGKALNNDTVLANNAKTLSDTVFKGYRDDLDFNDENDVGKNVTGEKKRLAFLDLMIESAQNGTNQISDHEIKEEVDTIMFELF